MVIIPTDEVIFFRGVGIPPTRSCRITGSGRKWVVSAWSLHVSGTTQQLFAEMVDQLVKIYDIPYVGGMNIISLRLLGCMKNITFLVHS
jgi:hypothetical protein